MLNRLRSHSFNAVGQTDLDDRLLQMDNRDSALTVPLPDSPRQLARAACTILRIVKPTSRTTATVQLVRVSYVSFKTG